MTYFLAFHTADQKLEATFFCFFYFPQIMQTIQTPINRHLDKRKAAYLCTVMIVNNKTEQATQTYYTSINLKPAEHKKSDPEEHPGCDSICMKCSGKKIFGDKKQISGSLGLLVQTVK